MEEQTSTLHIRQTGKFQFEVTVPAMSTRKTAPTLDSALHITFHDMLKHLTTRSLILVFADQHVEKDDRSVDAQACTHTDLEHQAVVELAHLGSVPQVKRSERHLVCALSHPLTRAQTTWLEKHAGTLFDSYPIEDGFEADLDAVPEEAHDNRKAARNE